MTVKILPRTIMITIKPVTTNANDNNHSHDRASTFTKNKNMYNDNKHTQANKEPKTQT